MQGEATVTKLAGVRDATAQSGALDVQKGSIGGGSGTITYSTLANVPKAKRQKLIAEAKPMVNALTLTVSVDGRRSQVS
jgi:hypothetical protein